MASIASAVSLAVGLGDFVGWLCRPKPPSPDNLYRDYEQKANRAADKICRQFARSGALAHRRDMQARCRLELWRACRKYDPAKNDYFWGYAFLRIRGGAYDYLREERIILKGASNFATALKFVSGNNEKTYGESSDESEAFGSWFENMQGTVASEHLPANMEARLDMVEIVERSKLTEEESQIIGLFFQDGWRVPEIAQQLDTPKAVVSESLKCALLKIRKALPAEYSRQ